MVMLLFAAAALATVPAPTRTSATVQATATIRVIKAVTLKFGSPNEDTPAPRVTQVKLADGSSEPVKVVEFQ